MEFSREYCLLGIIFYLVFVKIAQGRACTSIGKKVNDIIQDGSNVLRAKKRGIHKELLYEPNTKLLNKNLSDIQPLSEEFNFVHHWAILETKKLLKGIHGAKATISLHNLPEVEQNQYSESKFWVANKVKAYLEFSDIISAGYHVNPGLYGNKDSHLFVHTDLPRSRVRCYNLLCGGFVLQSEKYIPGQPLPIDGGHQLEITLKISKDKESGDWWLYTGPNVDEAIGYWPKSLLNTLSKEANIIQWGGVISFVKGEKSPPMGNGHYPHEENAAYFKDVRLITSSGDAIYPSTRRIEDKTDCYQLDGNEDKFYYGGPGGCID